MVEAGGGVFTESHTREFQVLAESGEDTIYFKEGWEFWKNREIMTDEIVLGVDANGNINSKQEIIYEGPGPFEIPYDKFLIPATAENWADVNFKAHIVTLTKLIWRRGSIREFMIPQKLIRY